MNCESGNHSNSTDSFSDNKSIFFKKKIIKNSPTYQKKDKKA